jgi:hypothetical protein
MMQLYIKLNLAATALTVAASLLALFEQQQWAFDWMRKLVHAIYSDQLTAYEKFERIWNRVTVVMLWSVPAMYIASLVLSIWSVHIHRNGYGIFLVVVGSVILLLALLLWGYAWILGSAGGWK